MRLSQKDRDILFYSEFLAAAPASVISKHTGYREHTVRYCLTRAREEGILSRHCFVDLFRLGFFQYELFFRLHTDRSDVRSAFAAKLRDCDRISWAGELGGEYEFGANFCARSPLEVSEFLNDLCSAFPDVTIERSLAVRVALEYYGSKFLSDKRRSTQVLSYGSNTSVAAIDHLDHRILRGLIGGEFGSRRRLAMALDIPLSTLELRIRRMQRDGIIVGFYHWLRPPDLEMQSFLMFVSARGISHEFQQSFSAFCRNHRSVSVLVKTIGNWDFEVAVEVSHPKEVQAISNEIYSVFGQNIASIRVYPSFAYSKVREYPFETFPFAGTAD